MENPVPPFNPPGAASAPPGVGSGPVKQTSGLAIASMVCGILGFLTCGVTGIPAIITGHIARSSFKRNPSLEGKGMALAGLITGYFSFLFIGVAMVSGLAAPVILKQRHAADRVQVIQRVNDARIALEEFNTKYGELPSDRAALKEPKFSALKGDKVLDQLETAGFVPETDDLLVAPKSAKGDWYYFPRAELSAPIPMYVLVSPAIGTKRIVLKSDGSVSPMESVAFDAVADLSGAVKILATSKK